MSFLKNWLNVLKAWGTTAKNATIRHWFKTVPTIALVTGGIIIESAPLLIGSIAVSFLSYHLHLLQTKIENTNSWWY